MRARAPTLTETCKWAWGHTGDAAEQAWRGGCERRGATRRDWLRRGGTPVLLLWTHLRLLATSGRRKGGVDCFGNRTKAIEQRARACLLDSIEVELWPLREVPVAPHRSSPRRRARARLSVCVTKSRFPAARFLSHESNTRRARPMEARGTTSLACCSVSCYVTPALAQSTVHAIGSFAGERLTAPAAAPRARSSRPSRRAFRRAVWPTRRANTRTVSLQRASGGNRCGWRTSSGWVRLRR